MDGPHIFCIFVLGLVIQENLQYHQFFAVNDFRIAFGSNSQYMFDV
jgi:hypothetical protein